MNYFYVCKFPLVKGKIKWRKAKKYLNRWHMRYMLSPDFQEMFASLKVGDWINDCTGLNGKLTELTPRYTTIYGADGSCFSNASILTDVDMCSVVAVHSGMALIPKNMPNSVNGLTRSLQLLKAAVM